MLRIGLTGGIGAGKSAVASRLTHHGAVLIDADRLAREVVAPGTDGLREVVDAFGPAVVGAGGALDRSALAARVFADTAARQRLEAIIHPRVRARTAALTAAAPPDAIVVNEVPLLVETGLAASYQLVLVVTAAAGTRVARLVGDATRGLDLAQAEARIQAQVSDRDRQAAADVLLPNDGSRAELAAAVDRLWRQRLVPYEANLRLGRPAPRPTRPVIVAPDPTWPQQAQRLLARLRRLLGERAVRIDHVGPTAVPGLAATDVLDVQVVTEDLAVAAGLAGELVEAGLVRCPGQWCDRGRDGRPHPKVVAGNADPGRAVDLHLRPADSPAWRDELLLREWLRATPAAVAEYARHKRELAAWPQESVEAYPTARTPWRLAALARADRWAAMTGYGG